MSLTLGRSASFQPDSIVDAGWSSPVARQAHNLKVVGSNPTPATNIIQSYQRLDEGSLGEFFTFVARCKHCGSKRGLVCAHIDAGLLAPGGRCVTDLQGDR